MYQNFTLVIDLIHRSALLLPLPGVQTRLSRHRRGSFGQLQVKVADQWINVRKKARAAKEGFELYEEGSKGGEKANTAVKMEVAPSSKARDAA